MVVTNRNPLTSVTKIVEVVDEVVRRPIPSLRLDDFDQTELLNYLEPIHEIADKVEFGVGSYTHPTVVNYGYAGGGIYSPTQNRIYLPPNAQGSQATWHYIDCETGSAVAYSPGVSVSGYSGGAYSPTQNRIYFAPFLQGSQATWHYVDCNTGIIEAYTHGFGTTISSYAYSGAVYSPTQNRIYFVPSNQGPETNWHYVDCDTGDVVAYANGAGASIPFNSTYVGGVYSPTQNRIYFIPNSQGVASEWHYIDCDTGNVVAYTHAATVVGTWAYFGGVYSPTQNRIYMVPSDEGTETQWHYIDCDTGDVVAYTHGFPSPDAYTCGCYSPTLNRIFFAPRAQNVNWVSIDCNTGEVVAYTNGVTIGANAYIGAVYSPTENKIYLIPQAQSNQTNWHYIQEYSDIPVSRNLMAGTLFNKF